MLAYIARRLILAVLTIWAITVLSFVIIQLPPGDYVSSYIASMSASGVGVTEAEAQALRMQYGLDQPIHIQYIKWMGLIAQGNFGMAIEWGRPVLSVIGDRMALTVVISLAAIVFTWALALPIGIYSAVKRYSIGDYIATFIGFIGLAIPGFMLALIVMYVGFKYFDANVGGLFSAELADAPWGWPKFIDLLKHLPIVAIVLGIGGTAQMIRIMRSNLLDELRKPYVMTARARGLSETRVILKYPVRVALNPFVSTIGYLFPYIVSGSIIVSMVLSLPTVGPLLLKALIAQDMFLAGTIVLMLGVMTVIGTFISDLLLMWIDPRIRLGEAVMNETIPNPTQTAPAPLPPQVPEPEFVTTQAEEKVAVATQWQLMWWRFRKHHLAMAGGIVLILFYLTVLGADFLAYVNPDASEAQRSLMVPQPVRWFDNGKFSPHVYAITGKRDPKTFKRVYAPNPDKKIPVRFFAKGFEYKWLELIPSNIHLIGVEGAEAGETLFLLGTDMQGRDLWSRLVYGTRTSLLIGLVSVALSLVLGVVLGGISGYYSGVVDTIIQRVIEILRSIPTIPLWMGLAAALPASWNVNQVYFAITIIISLLGWTELARVVRGRFLSLRQEDFVVAARLAGCGRMRIIFRHMVPSFLSHIIAATTLALPAMIISETSLSFLGLGLRPPAISWGVLLQDAQNIQSLAISPWLLIPSIPVIVAVLAFNFVGDGLRDAADPYG